MRQEGLKKHYKNEEMAKEKFFKYGSDLKVERQTKQPLDNKFITACPGAEIFDHRNSCGSSLISGNSPSMNSSVQVAIIFFCLCHWFSSSKPMYKWLSLCLGIPNYESW